MTFRFCHVTDIHISDRPVGNRVPSYPEDIKAKFVEVVDLCINEGRNLLVSGDLFEYKQPRMVSHSLVQWLTDQFWRLHDEGLDAFGIAGNHDLSEEGMASLWKQPLGTLDASHALTILREPMIVNYGDVNITFVPFNFHEDGEGNAAFFANPLTKKQMKQDSFKIALTHQALCPPEYDYPFPHVTYTEAAMDWADIVLCGHLHHAYPLVVLNDTYYVQYGSLARRSRTQQRDVRVGLGEVSKDGIEISSYTLKSARPHSEIFTERMTDIDETVLNPEMQRLAFDAGQLLSLDDVNFEHLLETMKPQMREETYTHAKHYLEEAVESISR